LIGPYAALLAASGLVRGAQVRYNTIQDLARTTDEAGIETDWRQVG